MGLIGHVLTLLLAGFVFAYTFHPLRYWLIRKQGYELLLAVLLPGWIIHAVVWGTAKLLGLWFHVPPVGRNCGYRKTQLSVSSLLWC